MYELQERGQLNISTLTANRYSANDTSAKQENNALSPIEEVSPVNEADQYTAFLKAIERPPSPSRFESHSLRTVDFNAHSFEHPGISPHGVSSPRLQERQNSEFHPHGSSSAQCYVSQRIGRRSDVLHPKSMNPSEIAKTHAVLGHPSMPRASANRLKEQDAAGVQYPSCDRPVPDGHMNMRKCIGYTPRYCDPQTAATSTTSAPAAVLNTGARYDFLNGQVSHVFPGYAPVTYKPVTRKVAFRQISELEKLAQSGQELSTFLGHPHKSELDFIKQSEARDTSKNASSQGRSPRDTVFVAKTINSGRQMISNIEASMSGTSDNDSIHLEDICCDGDFGKSAYTGPQGFDLADSDSQTSYESPLEPTSIYNLHNVSLVAIRDPAKDEITVNQPMLSSRRNSHESLASVYSSNSHYSYEVIVDHDTSVTSSKLLNEHTRTISNHPPDSPTFLEHMMLKHDHAQAGLASLDCGTTRLVVHGNVALTAKFVAPKQPVQADHVVASLGDMASLSHRRRSISAPADYTPRPFPLHSTLIDRNDVDRDAWTQEGKNNLQVNNQTIGKATVEIIAQSNPLDVAARLHKAGDRERDARPADMSIAHDDTLGLLPPTQRRVSSASRLRSTVLSAYFSHIKPNREKDDDEENSIVGPVYDTHAPPVTDLHAIRRHVHKDNARKSSLKKKRVKKVQIGAPHLLTSSSNVPTVPLEAIEHQSCWDQCSAPKKKTSLLKLLTTSRNKSQLSVNRCHTPANFDCAHDDEEITRALDQQKYSMLSLTPHTGRFL